MKEVLKFLRERELNMVINIVSIEKESAISVEVAKDGFNSYAEWGVTLDIKEVYTEDEWVALFEHNSLLLEATKIERDLFEKALDDIHKEALRQLEQNNREESEQTKGKHNFKHLLKSKGVTQMALAAHLGVDQTLVSQWCNGNIKMYVDTAVRVAEFLGCDIGEVVRSLSELSGEEEK